MGIKRVVAVVVVVNKMENDAESRLKVDLGKNYLFAVELVCASAMHMVAVCFCCCFS